MAEKVSVVIEVDSAGAVKAFTSAASATSKFGAEAEKADKAVRSTGQSLTRMGASAKDAGGSMSALNGLMSGSIGSFVKLAGAVGGAVAAYASVRAAVSAFFDTLARGGALDDLQQRIGIAAESLSRLELAAKLGGTSIEGLATGMKFLSKNLVDASVGGSTAGKALAGAFAALGVDAKTAVNDTNGALIALADQFKAMPDGAQKATLAMSLFGKGGLDLIPMLNLGGKKIAELAALSDKLGVTLSGNTAAAMAELEDRFDFLRTAITGVATQITIGMLPAFTRATDAIVKWLTGAGIADGGFRDFGNTIATTSVNIAASITSAMATALRVIGQFASDVASAGIGPAIANLFGDAFDSATALVSAAMLRMKATVFTGVSEIVSALSTVRVFPLNLVLRDAADNWKAMADGARQAATDVATAATSAGKGSDTLAGLGDKLTGAAGGLETMASGLRDAADGADQMSTAAGGEGGDGAGGAAGATAGLTTALGLLKDTSGSTADKLAETTDKLVGLEDAAWKSVAVYAAVAEGTMSYEEALVRVAAAQKAGEAGAQSAAAGQQAYATAVAEATAETAKQAAETANQVAETEALTAATYKWGTSGATQAETQRLINNEMIVYAANGKLVAGQDAALVEIWARQQEALGRVKVAAEAATAWRKSYAETTDLEKQIEVWGRVEAGVLSVRDAQRELAIEAEKANGLTEAQATALVDLRDKAKDAAEEAQRGFINVGDVLKSAFSQTFDAIVNGTRDLGDALEGIGLSIGKQFFTAILDDKVKRFDPAVKANFLDLGDFGTGVFGKVFSGAARLVGGLFGSGGGGGSLRPDTPIGQNDNGTYIYQNGSGEPIGYNDDGSYMFADSAVGAIGGASQMVGGINAMTGTATSSLGSLAGALGAVAGAASIAAAVLPLLIPLFEKIFDTTTKGTKKRREGEGFLDASPTFSALQERGSLGDFVRSEGNPKKSPGGLVRNYETGVDTAVSLGMTSDQATAIAGAGTGIFSKLFGTEKAEDRLGAKQMGIGLAEFFSRGLAEGMTFDEMKAKMLDFAREQGITVQDAMASLAKFGPKFIEDFGADGANDFAKAVYGVSEVFAGDLPKGVNVASIALRSMSKDGQAAIGSLDESGKEFVRSIGSDAAAFETVMSDLAERGFTIDTQAFKDALADITASAQIVGDSVAAIFTGGTVNDALEQMSDAVKEQIMAGFGEAMTADLFGTSALTEAFAPVFETLRELKDGAFDLSTEAGNDSFMASLAEDIAAGKASIEEAIPRLKAMKAAADEVQKAIDEAFAPTEEEQAWIRLAAAAEATATSIKGAMSGGVAAAFDLMMAGGTPEQVTAEFGAVFQKAIGQSVLAGLQDALVQSAVIEGALGELMTKFKAATAAAMADGIIDADEKAQLEGIAGEIKDAGASAAEALSPVVGIVADVGAQIVGQADTVGAMVRDVVSGASSAFDPFANLEEGQTSFGVFAQSIKDQIYGSVKDGLVQSFIDSAVTQGLLAGPLQAINDIFAAVGSKQMSVVEANAALLEQTAIINGTLGDPATQAMFQSVFDTIRNVGESLGQTTKQVQATTTTTVDRARDVVASTKDVCKGDCELQARTRQMEDANLNTFGRVASVSIEDYVPKLATGGLVTKPTLAVVGEAGPEFVLPVASLRKAMGAIDRTSISADTGNFAGLSAAMGGGDFAGLAAAFGGGDFAGLAAAFGGGGGGAAPADVAEAIKLVKVAAQVKDGAAGGEGLSEMADQIAEATTQASRTTKDLLGDLNTTLDSLAKALASQPAETEIKIDGEVLVRAMTKAKRLARKAGVEV